MATQIKFLGVKADNTRSGQVTLSADLLPTTVDVQDNTTSISYNTVLGDFVDFPIAIKRKVVMKFDILSDSQVDALYFDGLLNIVKTNKRRFFEVQVTGDNELAKKIHSVSSNRVFYLGTPVEFSRLGETDGITYYSGEIHLIQVTAYSLNNPVEQGGNS